MLLRPLSTEAFEHDCIFVYDPVGKNVWNGLIYAKRPGNPILKAVIEFMIEAGPSRWGGVLVGRVNGADTTGHASARPVASP